MMLRGRGSFDQLAATLSANCRGGVPRYAYRQRGNRSNAQLASASDSRRRNHLGVSIAKRRADRNPPSAIFAHICPRIELLDFEATRVRHGRHWRVSLLTTFLDRHSLAKDKSFSGAGFLRLSRCRSARG
jgi:hypothetical protein